MPTSIECLLLPVPSVSRCSNLQPHWAGRRSDVIDDVHGKTAHVTTVHVVVERQADVSCELDRWSRESEK